VVEVAVVGDAVDGMARLLRTLSSGDSAGDRDVRCVMNELAAHDDRGLMVVVANEYE
jgi:hypothetical protein